MEIHEEPRMPTEKPTQAHEELHTERPQLAGRFETSDVRACNACASIYVKEQSKCKAQMTWCTWGQYVLQSTGLRFLIYFSLYIFYLFIQQSRPFYSNKPSDNSQSTSHL